MAEEQKFTLIRGGTVVTAEGEQRADVLIALAPQPVVEINRAVAHAMVFGPEAGLEILDALADEPSLATYHLLPAVRGDLLERASRFTEASEAFRRAAELAQKSREKSVLLARADRMKSPT